MKQMDRKWPILVCWVSIVLQVVAFATPGWFRVAGINMGIWYMCVNGTCASNSDVLAGMKMSGATMSVYTTGFEEFQIESTLGLITGIIAMVVLCAFSRSSRHKKRESETWAAGLCIVSGICSWIPTGKFTRVYTTVPDSLGSLDVPYSIILMGVGATLAFLAAVILAVSNFDRLIQQPRDVAIQPPKYIMREVVPTQNNV